MSGHARTCQLQTYPVQQLEELALFDALKEAIELDKVAAEPEIKLAQPQICEWYPDGEERCTFAVTHAATKHIAATCDRCYAASRGTRMTKWSKIIRRASAALAAKLNKEHGQKLKAEKESQRK